MPKRKRTIEIARAYDSPAPGSLYCVLVDRLWPRGVKKNDLRLDAWAKDLAPSHELRKWFNHDPQLWDEFRERYFQELEENPERVSKFLAAAGEQDLLLLYGAKDEQHNNAAALKEYLEDNQL